MAPHRVPPQLQLARDRAHGCFPQPVDRQPLEQQGELRARARPRDRTLHHAVGRAVDAGYARVQPSLELAGVEMPPLPLPMVVDRARGLALGAGRRRALGAGQPDVHGPARDTLDNLPIRGVLPVSAQIHDRVRIIAGRMFAPGLNEVIIGKLLVHRYPGCSLGADLKLGRRTWKVVGVFESGGSSFESEVWADLHSLQEDARRGSSFTSIRLRLVPGADVHALIRRCADDPRINLQAETESEYYKEQSGIAANLRVLGLLVAGIMAFAAMFAAMNTMYAAVSARTSEIGTLRALGFSPLAIMTSFLAESSALAVAAGIIGVILALPVNGLSTKFNGGAVSAPTIAFNFHVTPGIVIQGLVFAVVIGALGGYLPARQAMRVTVVTALRRN